MGVDHSKIRIPCTTVGCFETFTSMKTLKKHLKHGKCKFEKSKVRNAFNNGHLGKRRNPETDNEKREQNTSLACMMIREHPSFDFAPLYNHLQRVKQAGRECNIGDIIPKDDSHLYATPAWLIKDDATVDFHQ